MRIAFQDQKKSLQQLIHVPAIRLQVLPSSVTASRKHRIKTNQAVVCIIEHVEDTPIKHAWQHNEQFGEDPGPTI